MGFDQKCHDSAPPGPRAFWPVDLKLTHLDWNPEATLIHFQGQYLSICELDYSILQGEIQNVPKAQATVDIGEFCLIEDVTSARWYRGRVQNQKKDLYDVFLIDYGNVLSVDEAHISSCSNDLFSLPPKIVCGFLSSILLLPSCCHSVVERYFTNQIGRNVTGYIQGLLPHRVLLLEAPDINNDLVHHGFGKHVDTDTFLLLIEMLTEAPLKQNIEPAPDLLIEKQRGQEIILKPTSLQGYEEILSSCRPHLKCGLRATVHVTAAVRPGLFYCQMADKESELRQLSNRLSAVCEFKAKINQQKTPDSLGLLCSVKGKDGNWYRGFVQHLPINSLVRVLFVDFGYFESVEVKNIHNLPPDFHSTPMMAFPCALSGINYDEALKSQQLGFLKTGLLGGQLEIEINKQEQHMYYITILSAKERVIPTPIQTVTCIKGGNSESKKEQNLAQNGHLFYETIMSEELDKTLEDEEVQVGSVFVGYLEHAQNPNQFWIRTEKRNEEFEEMMRKMSEHFSNVKLDEDVLENPEPGMLCCAVYEEDMHFYRGVVVDLLQHGAEVLFIDFGNIEKVPHYLIKKIPEEFADKSAFALCCSLVNVVPNDELWTSSVSDSFRQLLSNKDLQVHVMQLRKNKFDVDLYLVENGTVGKSISELLIVTNQAQYGRNISGQCMGKRNEISPVKKQIVKQNKQPLQNSMRCEDWTEEMTSAPKVETEKPKEPVCLKALDIKPGCEFAICCPLINTPSDFWCQRSDKVPALNALMIELQEHYSTKSVPLDPEALCCVVKSPEASIWCRGSIKQRQNGRATVILADFGTSVKVSEESLQGLLPEFCVLEGQAFRCSLYNVIEPPALCWTQEASEFLKRFVSDGESSLKCKVISQLNVRNKDLCNVVHLCNTKTNQSVSNLLLEQSLARVVTTTLSPAVFPETFVYSSYDLTAGTEESVYVTHVNSHFEVFCQLDKNTTMIEEIDAKICEIKKVEQANPEAAVEKLCLAKYLDGKWYRGIAYSAQSPSYLCVHFVDYGNTMIAEKKHVIFIPRDSTDLLYTPMQALKFTLAWVPQNLVFADVKEWLDAAVLNKQVRAVIKDKWEDGSFVVELFDGEVSINEKLKELIQSLTPKPKIAVTFKCSYKEMKQGKHVNGRYKQKTKCSPTSHSQNRTNYKNKPKTCSQNNRAGPLKSPEMKKKPNKVTNKEERNNEVSPVQSQTAPTLEVKTGTDEACKQEQPAIFQASCLQAIKLTEGLKLRCFVSHIDSLTSFYVQLCDDEVDILKFAEDLNSKVFKDTLKSTSDTILKVDDLVLAEYAEDGALYRAVLKEKVGFCTFKVEFVDFGNSAIVATEKMYLITEDYTSQPRYSIPCSLHSSTAFENSAAFTDAVMDKPLSVEFMCYKKSQWEVKVEILGATTTSILLETAPKETEIPQQISTSLEVKRPTQTKQKTSRCTKSPKKKPKKKSTVVDKLSDLMSSLMPPKIQSGNTHNGLVLSVQRNGDFFVKLSKSLEIAALEAMISMNIKYIDLILENHVKVGLQCLVQDQNSGPWRRAVVQEISQHECLVLLSDHGKMETVAKSSLRQMLSNLTMIPPFAVRCRLNLLSGSQQYSQMCYEAVKAIEGKELKFVFVDVSEEQQLWFVEMVVDGQFIMSHILNAERQTQQTSTKTHDCSPDTDLPQKLAFAPVELNKEYFGFAAAVTTPFDFCVVLEDFHLMSQVSTLLEGLKDELEPLPRAHCVPGTGCLVESESKSKWCRAEILHADSAPTLNLVDYGHDECLSYEEHSKLKKLPKCIAELPKVTYPCVLKAVRPAEADGQWSDEAAIFFQQCLDQRNLQIFFREEVSECQWKVDVLTDGVHLAKQLVDAGHASYTDVVLGLRFQKQSPRREESDEECDEDTEDGCRTLEEIEHIFKEESDPDLCMMM